MNPLISIGVTTYKRPEYLKECLRTILAQSFDSFEILVGNNDVDHPLKSSDLEIDDPRIHFVNHPTNLGQHGNMNALLRLAKGKYFTWLADDDLFLPGFLEVAIQGLVQSSSKVFFSAFQSGQSPMQQETFSQSDTVVTLTGSDFLKKYLFRNIETIGNYGVWDKNFLITLGGMPVLGTGFSPYSDNLLAMQAGELETVSWSEKKLVFFRTHDQSLSWTSTDLGAYTSAQKDWSIRSRGLIKKILQEDFNSTYYEFLKHWCLGYFYSVLERSPMPTRQVFCEYFSWLFSQAQELRWPNRIKLRFFSVLWGIRLIRRKLRARKTRQPSLVST